MTGQTAFERVILALEQRDSRVKGSGRQRTARCPAHDDNNASLSITEGTERVLIKCHATCTGEDVAAALGLTMADLYDKPRQRTSGFTPTATYDYVDEAGTLLFKVHRGFTDDTAKTFRQQLPNGSWKLGDTRRVLYRLPQLIEALNAGQIVYVVEGEKDVHAIESRGRVATCNPMGAGKWRDEYSHYFLGHNVIVIADKDQAGYDHAERVRKSLEAAGATVSLRVAAEGKDVADHLQAGKGLGLLAPFDPTPTPEKATEAPRKLVFRKASTITPRPVRWAWDTEPDAEPQLREGRFPIGSLAIAVGRAGVGKSQFAAWTTARITTGTLPGAFYGKPRAVVYAATEDSWQMTIVPRLIAAGADLDRVFNISVQDDGDMHATLTLPSDTRMLEQGITDYDVALVVMDPLLSLLDSGINDYRAREVREALEPLIAVADRTQVVLLGLAHFTKASGNDPLMLVSGSAAFGQLVRSAIAFARDEESAESGEEKFVCSTIKNNLGREDLPSLAYKIVPHCVDTPEGDAWVSRLEFTGEASERSVRDILRAASAPAEDAEDRTEVDDWLQQYLDSNAHRVDAKKALGAARAAGFSVDQAKRAKKRLKVKSVKSGMEGGWDWVGPEGVVDEPKPDPEGSTKGAKGAHTEHVHPSLPSVLPSVTEPLYSVNGDTPNGPLHAAVAVMADAQTTTCTQCDRTTGFSLINGRCRSCHTNRKAS